MDLYFKSGLVVKYDLSINCDEQAVC